MVRILHFADAHIDMANYGRHDPLTGIPYRIQDFLKSLDTIVDTAIDEKVDLVLFAGDTYRDRSPAPTYQREWQKRIMRLSEAGIPTLLLVGNHDISPAVGRANALQEFDTLHIPHIHLLQKPALLLPDHLEGLPLQVIAMPWVTRSSVAAGLASEGESSTTGTRDYILNMYTQLVDQMLSRVDPRLPVILAAHASVQGALYGGERMIMLGEDLVLPPSLVKDTRIDYTALGHIHKMQDLNPGAQPPVIYPGSIERVDFGEARDKKYFVLASVEKRNTRVVVRELTGIRPFIDRSVRLEENTNVMQTLLDTLAPQGAIKDAIVRLIIEYPPNLEPLIDENAIREYARETFEFHLIRRPDQAARIRLPADQSIHQLSPLELTDIFWDTVHTSPDEKEELQKLVRAILTEVRQQS